jgi:ABC-type multidrug transport system fused ATPase/permease subunit
MEILQRPPKADRPLAALWWTLLILRGVLPAAFAVAMGPLVGAVQSGDRLGASLTIVGIIFVLLQILTPIHQAVSANLGDRTAAWLYDRLTEACVRPPGMGHLEDEKLTGDLVVARDFDLGMTGPPLSIAMDFVASDGLVGLLSGLSCALVLAAYAWWAPIALGGAWLSTHWLLRESAVWRDRNTAEVRAAQRDADYAYRLAVDPAPAKELRLFGLADWTIDRFTKRRTLLHKLQYEATRLREKPVLWCLLLVTGANLLVFWSLASAAANQQIDLARAVVFAQSAVGVSMIAFGGLNWVLDGAAAPVVAVLKLESAMAPAGAIRSGTRPATGLPAREIRFRDVTFAYPAARRCSIIATSPFRPALRWRSSDATARVRRRWPNCCVVCTTRSPARSRLTASTCARSSWPTGGTGWRQVFQDFIKFELPLRDNVAPAGAPDEVVRAALESAGAANLATLDTILARGYEGGTDLSGGQWQRIALARALCAVQLGAGVVLLDEPTAQLDVRGEAEIFDRILNATRHSRNDPILAPVSPVPPRPTRILRARTRSGWSSSGRTTSLWRKTAANRKPCSKSAGAANSPATTRRRGVTYDVLN